MPQHYSDPRQESARCQVNREFGTPCCRRMPCPVHENLRVFYINAKEAKHQAMIAKTFGEHVTRLTQRGWYWQPLFPRLSAVAGPFATEAEALADAREGMESDDE